MREKIMNAIREHVAAEYPNEACGVIIQDGQSQEYIRCRNISDTPKEHFTLSPDDMAEAESRGEVLMVVHSHPDVVQLIPSELDRIQCDHSGVEWGIMSWPDGDFCTISPRGDRELAGRRWVLGHADCWSLVRDYFRLEHGITLGNWSVDYEWWVDGNENRYDDNWQREGFMEVDATAMQPGDVIMMRVRAPVTNHAAVYLGNNNILHHAFGNLSARVPYGKYYRDRTVRIVRHKELFSA
ncbi:C40 family peptidase [Pantoea cypripedii]|uniref:Peptidase P60 n=1 Tax=Pantoea cypripedii TaxID=55209 RepID=A0A1X1ETC8_PANCY|nr:C40 family peptidase [Pantoea cypripedii]MBP2197229.1 proteasome lid subunit RPN8/RPN11 [Pantoea cypripedii]ORM93153.1 peptidase P60 [Pantoea cypripedii]